MATDPKQGKFVWKQTPLQFQPIPQEAQQKAGSTSDPKPTPKAFDIILNQRDSEIRAEAIWAMNVASNNYSFLSSSGDTFRAMLPDS